MSPKTDKSPDQVAAEEEVDEFREDLGPFVVAAETTRMAMLFTSAKQSENPIIFANQSFLRLTGYERDEVLGQSFNSMMARGAAPETLQSIKAAFEGTSEKIWRFSTAASMATPSGRRSSSARFATTTARSSSISCPSSI